MKRYRHLYGPVPSRRLGRSLGIDLVPHKVCTYDCIYCQIGKTTRRTLERKEYISRGEVLDEVKAFLSEEDSPIDHFSLSGSGEPTLHSKIRSIIDGIKTISSTPVAVITNGSLLWDREVMEDLLGADVVLPSMDAVSPEIFERINRPYPGLSAETVIRGMAEFRKMFKGRVWLEILLCKGVNDTPDELQKMKEAAEQIAPDLIHLNTVVRPPSEGWANSLSPGEMDAIRAFFGGKASIISGFDRHSLPGPETGVSEMILNILARRPLSFFDLSQHMGLSRDELETLLKPLVEEGKIRIRSVQDSVYYEAVRG